LSPFLVFVEELSWFSFNPSFFPPPFFSAAPPSFLLLVKVGPFRVFQFPRFFGFGFFSTDPLPAHVRKFLGLSSFLLDFLGIFFVYSSRVRDWRLFGRAEP